MPRYHLHDSVYHFDDPVSLGDILDEVQPCEAVGCSRIHVHVRPIVNSIDFTPDLDDS